MKKGFLFVVGCLIVATDSRAVLDEAIKNKLKEVISGKQSSNNFGDKEKLARHYDKALMVMEDFLDKTNNLKNLTKEDVLNCINCFNSAVNGVDNDNPPCRRCFTVLEYEESDYATWKRDNKRSDIDVWNNFLLYISNKNKEKSKDYVRFSQKVVDYINKNKASSSVVAPSEYAALSFEGSYLVGCEFGRERLEDVFSGCAYVPPIAESEIKKELDDFAQELSLKLANEGLDSIDIAAFAHNSFIKTHPFSDGNGRTARLLMNMILIARNNHVVVFPDSIPYLSAIWKGDENFALYIKNKLEVDKNKNMHLCSSDFCNRIGGFTCAHCKSVFYCSKNCQKLHWSNGHKKLCTPIDSKK